MTLRMNFVVHLTNDAEPGSGIGSELVNAFVPRTAEGFPCLLASHIRGLVRQNLHDLEDRHAWVGLADAVLGISGMNGSDGNCGRVRFTDAVPQMPVETRFVTRTAIGEWGVAKDTSLRTVELIPAGTEMQGTVTIESTSGSVVDLAVRVALLMTTAVGGGRTRGSGACWISLQNEDRTPGRLLEELGKAIEKQGIPQPRVIADAQPAKTLSGKKQWVRFVFRARSPLCCPESPTVGINVVRSGFVIPASALIGALLGRVDETDSALASACFAEFQKKNARMFPLLPVAQSGNHEELPYAVRVSMTHRMSKLPNEKGQHVFQDESIEPYDWREVPAGSPLKAADGVLMVGADHKRRLWMAKDMPRLVQTHGVHRDPQGNRNLYTVESLAPLVFSGWAILPEEFVDALQKMLKTDAHMVLGRSRGSMGDGELSLFPVSASDILKHACKNAKVWVVQSPIAIPENASDLSAEEHLYELARAAGWPVSQETWAKAGIRFGWNRHGLGTPARAGHRRLKARRCILPGSVLVLEKTLENPEPLLVQGLGDGAEFGFGALLPHPGRAEDLYRPQVALQKIESRNTAAGDAFKLWQLAGPSGPTPSQIAHLAGKLASGQAVAWLEKQKTERSARIWNRWFPVYEKLLEILKKPAHAAIVLRVWQDLVIANRKGER